MIHRYSQGNWPDKRETLIHLTKDAAPGIGFPDGYLPVETAKNRLASILHDKKIRGSYLRHMRFLDKIPYAVAFSEALPSTIVQLAKRSYSEWGIHVHKFHAFQSNGGPVWYLNNEHFKALTNDLTAAEDLDISDQLLFLLTPFAPVWQDEVRLHNDSPNDWTQEREWRVPGDFDLPYVDDKPDFEVIVPNDEGREYVLSLDCNGLTATDIKLISELV